MRQIHLVFPSTRYPYANRSRVNSSASPSAAGFTAVAVTCHTNRQAMGRNSSGLAVIVRGRPCAKRGNPVLNPPPNQRLTRALKPDSLHSAFILILREVG